MEADEGQGHFKAKIGISRKTWSQEIDIKLTEQDKVNMNIAVRIVAHHILYDRGQNDEMITKFFRKLEHQSED